MKKYAPLLILGAVLALAIWLYTRSATSNFIGHGQRRASDIRDVWVTGMGPSPARISRKTGVRYLNADVMQHLSRYEQEFIKLHEEAHYVLNTRVEEVADEYAFKKYAALGYPLSESVSALTDVLDQGDPNHDRRVKLHWDRVRQYDRAVNGNKKVRL